MARSEESKQRRIARYNYLRELGYSPAEARRLRDTSGETIEKNISQTALNLARRRRLSERERDRLSRIQEAQRSLREEGEETRQIIESRPQRVRNWKNWSKSKEFPDWIQSRINDLNTSPGRSPFSSYGYRVLYMRYVQGVSVAEALRYARRMEGRDT